MKPHHKSLVGTEMFLYYYFVSYVSPELRQRKKARTFSDLFRQRKHKTASGTRKEKQKIEKLSMLFLFLQMIVTKLKFRRSVLDELITAKKAQRKSNGIWLIYIESKVLASEMFLNFLKFYLKFVSLLLFQIFLWFPMCSP